MNPFEQFFKDTIRIVSQDGKKISDTFKALVNPTSMNLYNMDIDFLDGDIIERDLPNNKTERYRITKSDYHSGLGPIPKHWVLKLQKTSEIKPKSITQTKITYNLHGDNSRVYHNSNDNSSNVVNASDSDVFYLLKQLIEDKIDNNSILLNLLEELEQSKGSADYLTKYSAFIANAANHMTLIAPMIPALTAFIPGH